MGVCNSEERVGLQPCYLEYTAKSTLYFKFVGGRLKRELAHLHFKDKTSSHNWFVSSLVQLNLLYLSLAKKYT